MGLKAAKDGISKTRTEIGSIPATRSHGINGGRAKGAKTDRSGTASEMSGNCGKLAAGPCNPKPGK